MEDLCKRLARDLDAAFPELVREMQAPLYSGLRRLHGTDAEDLTQEAFIRAYNALAGYDPDRVRTLSLRGWMWTIAMNLGRNALRDRARRPIPAEFDDPTTCDPEPPDTASWDRRLATLSKPQRDAIVLRHVVGLTIAETSQALGRPEGTVKADVHRGLEKLRTIMEAEQ
ncbi:MAG: RNA polymerase sigma factor [Acidimicrobiia bacterium]|nr:RNA polymerase sigma factor [Acidimicrobiia bacterium]MDH4306926.1 RNA polymerase sigma factor [Acidimicrobiia bacterium]MDH5520741.1 RNA polymerase sigma factor [Acidimicrobiia bacterium]